MEISEILKRCDHTLLSPTATWEEIRAVIDDGIAYGTASVCIPPCFVGEAKKYAEGKIAICTVIGFPNGYNTKETKVYETAGAVLDGADEIDMVINIGDLKARNYRKIFNEILTIRAACAGKILKVIVETCLLTEEEKLYMCEIVARAKADFIKTSTGFSKGGATFEDVELFKKYIDENHLKIKIKAAGGISSLDDAEKFIALGAERLGTSRVVKIAKEMEAAEEVGQEVSEEEAPMPEIEADATPSPAPEAEGEPEPAPEAELETETETETEPETEAEAETETSPEAELKTETETEIEPETEAEAETETSPEEKQ